LSSRACTSADAPAGSGLLGAAPRLDAPPVLRDWSPAAPCLPTAPTLEPAPLGALSPSRLDLFFDLVSILPMLPAWLGLGLGLGLGSGSGSRVRVRVRDS